MTNQHFKGEDLETRVRQLEEDMAALRGDSRLANLPYGTLKESKSHLALRSIGGVAGGAYPAGVPFLKTVSAVAAISANYLYAIPFYVPGVPNMVARMGIRVTTAVSGSARLGIYADKEEAMLYPHRLLLDAGVVSTSTTGVKGIDIKHGLPRGLVWIALVASATPTVQVVTTASPAWAILGFNELGTSAYTYYMVSQAYGSLPDPFPAGATERAATFPYIFLKFS